MCLEDKEYTGSSIPAALYRVLQVFSALLDPLKGIPRLIRIGVGVDF